MKNITVKQRRFIQGFLATGNGTRAAIQAGYSPRSAGSMAYQNLKNYQIRQVIQSAYEQAGLNTAGFARTLQQGLLALTHGGSGHRAMFRAMRLWLRVEEALGE